MALEKEVEVEENFTYPFLRGKQIRRYVIPATDSRLICPYEITSESCHLLSLSEMSNKFPLALSYLNKNRSALSAREGGKLKGQNWYGFGYPKSMNLFQHPKIIVPDYNNVASFTFDAAGHFYKTGYGVILKDPNISPLYVLALLNSTLLFRYLASISTSLRGGYVRFWNQYIGELPIQFINFNNSSQKVAHDRIVVLVDRMFELHKKANALPPSSERERVEREIALTDEKIDEIVYGLYGITEAEKKIIEE